MLIEHRGDQVTTTLEVVRDEASSLFPHSAIHGWRVFVGPDLQDGPDQDLRFVPDEANWLKRFRMAHVAARIEATTIFVQEVSAPGRQATLSDSRPAAAADLNFSTTPVELQAAAKAAARLSARTPS
eukprot:4559464-Prymnesium_polylepis.1